MRVSPENLLTIIKKTDREKLRDALRVVFSHEENFDTFSYFFFSHVVKTRIPDFHREIYGFLFSSEDEAMAAPRGFAKSTVVGLIYIIWCIVNKREEYIVYVSQSYEKTIQFIEPMAREFKNNERIKAVYGDLTPSNAKDDDGKYRQDIIDVNGVRVQAASFEKNIRGFKYIHQRPTLIILDDIESDERVINPDLRLKDQYKLDKIIIPSLDATKGKIKMIGTILHWDSLLVKKIRLYNGKIYRAIDSSGNSLWPDYWPVERLMKKKESIGSVAFSSEYLNDPTENTASIIKREWIVNCYDEKLSFEKAMSISYDRKLLGCDFAFGDRITNDKSAYVGLGSHNNRYIVCQIDTYKGLSITEQFDILERMFKNGGYQEVVMEENSIKGMSKELYRYKMKYYLIWTGANDPSIKSRPELDYASKRHSVGKKNMILRLATQFENENIKIPYKTQEDREKAHRLTDELLTFALSDGKLVEVGEHADIPVGLAMALERMNAGEVIIDF